MERQQENAYNDEIDLQELARAIWNTRKLVLAGVALVVLGYLLLLALQVTAFGTTTTYSKTVRFTFDGIGEGHYPGGTRFRLADVISAPVLMRVYDRNGLADLGINFDNFADAIGIAPYTPRREFIVERYQKVLGRKDLSVTEMQEQENRFAAELANASRVGAQITLTTNQRVVAARGLKIDGALAAKLVNDIPLEWTAYMREVRGVDRPRLELFSDLAIDEQFIRQMDYLIVFEYLRDKIGALIGSVSQLSDLPNADSVRDPESNLRLRDVGAHLQDVRGYLLESMMAPVVGLGLARMPDRTRQYFMNRIAQLERERELAESNARQVYATLENYSRAESSEAPPRVSTGGFQGGTTIPQFGSDFLDRLVQLGTDAADVEFRQDLSRKHLNHALEAVAITASIKRLRDMVDLIEKSQKGKSNPEALLAAFSQELDGGIGEILDLLRENTARVERIADAVVRLTYGSDKPFFQDITDRVEIVTDGRLRDRFSPLPFALAVILTAFMMVFIGLLRNMMRKK